MSQALFCTGVLVALKALARLKAVRLTAKIAEEIAVACNRPDVLVTLLLQAGSLHASLHHTHPLLHTPCIDQRPAVTCTCHPSLLW